MRTMVSMVFRKKGTEKKFGVYRIYNSPTTARKAIRGLSKSKNFVRVGKIKSVR